MIGVVEVKEVAVMIGTGSWGGKGECQASGEFCLTGVHTRFSWCPY